MIDWSAPLAIRLPDGQIVPARRCDIRGFAPDRRAVEYTDPHGEEMIMICDLTGDAGAARVQNLDPAPATRLVRLPMPSACEDCRLMTTRPDPDQPRLDQVWCTVEDRYTGEVYDPPPNWCPLRHGPVSLEVDHG